MDITVEIIAAVLGTLLGAAIIWAPLLRWRASAIKNWSVSYKSAFAVSAKAAIAAVFIGFVVTIIGLMIFGVSYEEPLRAVATIIQILSWYSIHSSCLFKLAQPLDLISYKDARSITGSVLAHFIFGVLAAVLLSLALLFIFQAIF